MSSKHHTAPDACLGHRIESNSEGLGRALVAFSPPKYRIPALRPTLPVARQPATLPALLGRHVCQPTEVWFMRWRSQRPWDLVSENLTCPMSSLHPGWSLGFLSLGAIFQPTALFYPQTIAGILDSRTLGAVALSAWGIALTRNHVGKEPPAGKPGQRTESKRRWKGEKGAAAGRADQRQKPAGVNRLRWGGCPG